MKARLSDKTGKIIAKKIQKDVHEITEDAIIAEKTRTRKAELNVQSMNKYIYLIGIVGPVLAAFQAAKIFFSQTAAGVSVVYWGAYLIVAAAWFAYGFYYKSKPIMVVYGLWVFVEIIILNGIFYYGP